MEREYYDKCRLTKVCELPTDLINNWLTEELTNLYWDFAQKIELEQLKHEAKRLKETIKSPQYSGWDCGDVHAALQTMLSSGTNYRKLSFFTINSALSGALKQRQQDNRIDGNKSEPVEIDRILCQRDGAYHGSYIVWWMQHNIDPKQVDVHMYNLAVKGDSLNSLTDKYKNTRVPGFITKAYS